MNTGKSITQYSQRTIKNVYRVTSLSPIFVAI